MCKKARKSSVLFILFGFASVTDLLCQFDHGISLVDRQTLACRVDRYGRCVRKKRQLCVLQRCFSTRFMLVYALSHRSRLHTTMAFLVVLTGTDPYQSHRAPAVRSINLSAPLRDHRICFFSGCSTTSPQKYHFS